MIYFAFAYFSEVPALVLGRLSPGLDGTLDVVSLYANGAPEVSIPISSRLFFMMYPIMV